MSINAEELAKNPLIGLYPGDTLDNAVDALSYLQTNTFARNHSDDQSSSAKTGFYFLMQCIQGALEYESARDSHDKPEADYDE